jgi:hypothetical protein
MSEKIYGWLLRLYPPRFRERYGEEALQLFRDRAGDETGFLRRLRLWLDLLADLAVSVPREHRYVQPLLQPVAGLPAFQVLEGESPHFGRLLFGGIVSLVIFAAFPALLSQSKIYRSPGAFFGLPQNFIERSEREQVIATAAANLKRYYFDPQVGGSMADALLAHAKSGDDDSAKDGDGFADLLTRQMRDVSHDMHLELIYSQRALPDGPHEPGAADQARYRSAMEQNNCTFEKVEMLPHKIGYLKLNSFPETSVCRATAAAAMTSLNHADALIFDLRYNWGGYPEMVSFIAAYLFDHPEYLYNPRSAPTEESWTRSPVAGNQLADKPVYVLTSASTWSGAEQFSYDLKMLKRATLVGETTRGGAHAGVFHRIDDHYGMGIPEVRAINPFGKADWEGIGVEPDVKVQAADALQTAEKLAARKMQ